MIGELFVGELTINLFLQNFSTPIITMLFIIITMLGDPFFWIIISAVFFWWEKEEISMKIATIIFFNAIILGILKYTIMRPRPDIPILEEFTTEKAFPSGHASILTTIYSFFEKKMKRKEKIILIIIILINGISRLYLGVHYLSDILFGILLGYCIGKIILRYENKLEKIRLKLKENRKKVIPFLLLLTTIIILTIPNKLFLAIMLIGYFIGYLLHNKMIVKTKIKNKIIYSIVGIIILIIIGDTATKTNIIISGILFLIGGIFITWIWPIIINKIELKLKTKL
ncbi:MAG: phosphatase PAP2 family protein [Candidatus ainarchaeum sp.]|nr:phosphatase PAP2 family protein [Candidatus ainarchaeum sp.]